MYGNSVEEQQRIRARLLKYLELVDKVDKHGVDEKALVRHLQEWQHKKDPKYNVDDNQRRELFSIVQEQYPNEPVAKMIQSPTPGQVYTFTKVRMSRKYAKDENAPKIWIENPNAHAEIENQVRVWVEEGHMSLKYGDHFRSFVDVEAACGHAFDELDKYRSVSRLVRMVPGIEEYSWTGVLLERYDTVGESSESKPIYAIAQICMVDEWPTEGSQ